MKGTKTIATVASRLLGIVLLLGLGVAQSRAQSTAVIYLDSLRQVIRGFGAANIVGWRSDMTSDEIQTAFGTGEGQIGFSILRLRIPPDSTQFNIDLPSAVAAAGMGVTLIATPWTPPAWMKTNNNAVKGSLDTNNYASYARHLKAFADTMASHGAPLYAISVQNEPDANVSYESCFWNATQFLNFMKNNASSIGVPVFMPESQSFTHSFSDATLNDSAACAHTAFIGGHIYGATPTSYPLALAKGKELWMTEYLINSPGSGANMDTSLKGAMATAKSINDCLNANMSAYIWWYIVRYYGPIDDGQLGGVAGSITRKGYVMSQFARFVRPKSVRVLATVPQGSVYVTAYNSAPPGSAATSKFVIVALNLGSAPVNQAFAIQDIAIGTATVTPYVTSRTKNCEQQAAIAVSNGTFTATLADSSITTFVGNVVTGVDDGPKIPRTSELYQNYPNPFNPTTEIRYDVAERSFVSVAVYDLLGRKVATLVNQVRNPGQYRITFDPGNLPSGVYFYRLESLHFSVTKKLILMK